MKKKIITPLFCIIKNIETDEKTIITPLSFCKIRNYESRNKEIIKLISPFLCYCKNIDKKIISCSFCHFSYHKKNTNCIICILFCNCQNCFFDPFLIDTLFVDDLPLELTLQERDNLISLCICKCTRKINIQDENTKVMKFKKISYSLYPLYIKKQVGPEIQKMTD
jgi:hypothetical protein